MRGCACDDPREIESGGVWVRVPNQNCLSVCDGLGELDMMRLDGKMASSAEREKSGRS